ncbi:putative serine esterase [Suhomyces tanzawaensis NRRL Y-17324]|uniref:Putative serine esterase n=1 Tax=Suhomyces tanzawaensis NRRL Y-17324 TaxID=984487 RepID=A0A1E4SM74_9ASCO|nr:putative serine esterase [Suhomyces tanzawaensis NRRL Y-17324]ODV80610.1 putative serine esterase [Suhomyces tanzawaensis NRRL Y-17324]
MSETSEVSKNSTQAGVDEQDAHLFVLVHGLWGGPNHMRTIESTITDLLPDISKEKIVTLKPSSFRFWKTYDGLRLNSQKVITEIFYEIEALKGNNLNVKKISFVGYSLGGLICRYIIGLLNEINFFDHVEPIIFTTFATPHVGIEFFNKNIFDSTANKLGRYLFGKSGRELFLHDTQKALKDMADPEKYFYQGLEKFQKHILLANIKNDRSVAFYTSYITEYSPFDDWSLVEIKYLSDLPTARIGKSHVKPKFVDLTQSNLLTKTEAEDFAGNIQEETSILRRNKIIKVLVVIAITLFFLPIWIPTIVSTSVFVSVYSLLKIRIVTAPNIEAHWARVRDSVFRGSPVDPQDAKVGQDRRDQRRRLARHESFKGDTSQMTENALENFMYAEERFHRRSNAGNDDNIIEEEDGQDDDEEEELTTVLGRSKHIEIDVPGNDGQAVAHLETLRLKDLSKFPLFTEQAKLAIGADKKFIIDNLNQLNWIKIPVYLDCWNAHDAIVSRRGPRTNAKGTSVIGLWCSILRNHLSGKDKTS